VGANVFSYENFAVLKLNPLCASGRLPGQSEGLAHRCGQPIRTLLSHASGFQPTTLYHSLQLSHALTLRLLGERRHPPDVNLPDLPQFAENQQIIQR
jgi:hypothetical protein